MLHSIKRFAFVISCCVNLCLAYQTHDVKGGQYISSGAPLTKSYGGYNYDSTSNQHQQAYQTYSDQIHQPVYFPFYGLNFNHQPPAIKTYSGVLNNQQNGFGWFNLFPTQGPISPVDQRTSNSDDSNNVIAPPLPNYTPFFIPNYYPQQQYSPGQYPYPNFNIFPFPINNNNLVPSINPPTFPQQPLPVPPEQPNHQQTDSPSTTQFITTTLSTPNRGSVRFTTTKRPTFSTVSHESTTFPSDVFFNNVDEKNRAGWTENDERQWRATTKAPYFENKVPGLECTLPAAAVLGAISALKASSYLPLEVPVGKPILSCNATNLAQAIISLDGKLYDCKQSSISLSCPQLSTQYGPVDECLGEILECDVNDNDYDDDERSRRVSCTNGTLISKHYPIRCDSAHITQTKNILNCVFSNGINNEPSENQNQLLVRPIHVTERPDSQQRLITTLLPPHSNGEDLIDVRFNTGNNDKQQSALPSDLKRAMSKIFPSELLSGAAKKLYLPPKSSNQLETKLPEDLKSGLDGVFPHELLAMSRKINENKAEIGESLSLNFNFLNQPDVKGEVFKKSTTRIPLYVRVEEDDNDRHIFSQ